MITIPAEDNAREVSSMQSPHPMTLYSLYVFSSLIFYTAFNQTGVYVAHPVLKELQWNNNDVSRENLHLSTLYASLITGFIISLIKIKVTTAFVSPTIKQIENQYNQATNTLPEIIKNNLTPDQINYMKLQIQDTLKTLKRNENIPYAITTGLACNPLIIYLTSFALNCMITETTQNSDWCNNGTNTTNVTVNSTQTTQPPTDCTLNTLENANYIAGTAACGAAIISVIFLMLYAIIHCIKACKANDKLPPHIDINLIISEKQPTFAQKKSVGTSTNELRAATQGSNNHHRRHPRQISDRKKAVHFGADPSEREQHTIASLNRRRSDTSEAAHLAIDMPGSVPRVPSDISIIESEPSPIGLRLEI